MKELSIEDKAKRFDEALANAKYYHSEMEGDVCCVLEECFPELKESDDESIRQQILYYFISKKVNEPQPVLDSWIAWLEKQKEFVSADFDDVWNTADCDELTAPLEKYSKDAIKEMCHAWYDKGIELERRNWLEKQGEPKTELVDEDEIYWLAWVIGRLPDTEQANEAEAVLKELLGKLEKIKARRQQ